MMMMMIVTMVMIGRKDLVPPTIVTAIVVYLPPTWPVMYTVILATRATSDFNTLALPHNLVVQRFNKQLLSRTVALTTTVQLHL